MSYDFDKIIDRRNTDSLKYDFAVRRGRPKAILPLWVADMDFQTPDCVIDALVEKSRHGIYGYSEPDEKEYFSVLKNWFGESFGWEIQPNWLIKTPGVVVALCAAVRSLTEVGDSVIIQQPVYYPFHEAVIDNGRKLVVNELKYENGRYTIDFDDFERKIVENDVKLFILCNPHNPVGRVWTREELTRLGEICAKRGVIVVSDEIHADFIYAGHKHTVFADIRLEFAEISVTCTAPSKTFNLAGLQVSNIFIPNDKLRIKFKRELTGSGLSQMNIMGIVACRAAYSGGREWLNELKTYLAENLDFLRAFLKENLPSVKLVEPQGTYLVWLDCRELNLADSELDEIIVNKAGLWLDNGTMFGAGGSGFQRVNIACPRSILEKALLQLKKGLTG